MEWSKTCKGLFDRQGVGLFCASSNHVPALRSFRGCFCHLHGIVVELTGFDLVLSGGGMDRVPAVVLHSHLMFLGFGIFEGYFVISLKEGFEATDF